MFVFLTTWFATAVNYLAVDCPTCILTWMLGLTKESAFLSTAFKQGIGSDGAKECQETPQYTTTPSMNCRYEARCIHVFLFKFCPNHLNVAADSETRQIRQHFFNLQLFW